MAKKTPSLLDTIDTLPSQNTTYGWRQRIERKEPEFHAELSEVVRRFASNDSAIVSKFPNRLEFCNWLAKQINDRGYSVTAEIVLHWYDREKTRWRKA